MAADLFSAVVAKLRATPAVVSALGENLSVPHGAKIWLDFAEGRPVPPWITIVEVGESASYESPDDGGIAHSYGDGHFQVSVFAVGKKQSRDIGRLVVLALADANLIFDDGVLLELRDGSRSAQVEHAIAPGSPTIYHHIIDFHYLVYRKLITIP